MKLEILDEAAAELHDAIFRYESIEFGLGIRFKQELKAVVEWIGSHAEMPRIRPGGFRRVNLKIFPYYLPETPKHRPLPRPRRASFALDWQGPHP